MRVRLLCAFVALAALLAVAPGAARADEGWTIDRFTARIDIQPDASLLVTEVIDVDFGTLEKHGIFREIPIEYNVPGDDAHNRIHGFEAVSVTDATGKPWAYAQSRVGANVQLKIGDANRTISGKQSYRITYRVRDALNAFADHDELYWNVNGAEWPVPTTETTALVALSGGGLERLDCFEGRTGATEHCTAGTGADNAGAFFSATRPFASGEQMTIVVAIRKGAVATPVVRLAGKPKSTFEQYFEFTPWTIGATIVTALAALAFFARNWWRNGRDRAYTTMYYLTHDASEHTRPLFHRDQVVVEFTPPEDLRPALMGVLLDERADSKDASATIVDLAVRGYLAIEELDKAWVFSKKDWKLTKKKPGDDLQPFEQTILDGLFKTGDDVHVSDLKNKYHTSLEKAQEQLYAATVRQKWFAKAPDAARSAASAVAVGVAAAGAATGFALGYLFGGALIGAPIVAVGALMLATSAWMPKRTAKGSEALRRVLGFRLYIDTAETRRMEFAEKANIFAAYLPYAIVFGCVEKWAHVFRDIDTSAATAGWYVGAAAFSAPDFSRSMETFASSVSHVITSTPGSSGHSGFGGGGFSGGGGGGGGGGSW